jgi:ribosomal protein S18 acetylase RimI-like enzyme
MPADRSAWMSFVADIPSGEERFFKEDLTDPDRVGLWSADHGWLVAVGDGEIAGVISVLPGRGWSSHVAELRLVVRASQRGRGIGRELAHHGLVNAIERGCTHVYVEVVAEQEPLISMFRSMGFRPEAILEDFVRDSAGKTQDLMLLTHHAADNWSALAGIGLEEADA